MTRPTRDFGRTVRRLIPLALAFLAGATVLRAVTPIQPHDVHLSGDGAAQLADALFVWPGPPRAADPAFATTQMIAIRRWQNLEGLTDVARLCGAACEGRAGVVTIRRPALNGMTQVILVDLGDFGAGEWLDTRRPVPGDVISCVVEAIETARTGRMADPGGCDVIEMETVTRPRFWSPRPPSSDGASRL